MSIFHRHAKKVWVKSYVRETPGSKKVSMIHTGESADAYSYTSYPCRVSG